MKDDKNKQLIKIIIIASLLLGLAASVVLVQRRQEIRKKAESSSVTLSLLPSQDTFPLNGSSKNVQLVATFNGGSTSEKLDGFKTEIDFPNTYFNIPPSQLINVSTSGFDTALRIETPQYANQTGKIIIELVHLYKDPNKPPPATDQPVTIATIAFQGIQQTSNPQQFTINVSNSQVVNNLSHAIPINPANNAIYSVGPAVVTNTPVPTGSCAPPPAPVITSLGCFLSTTITNQRVRTIWQAPSVPAGCGLDPYFSTDPVNHHPYEVEVDDDPTFPHNFDPTFIGTTVDNYYANYLGTTDSTSQTAFFSSSPTLPKTVYARVRARNIFGQLSNWSGVVSYVVGPLTCTTDGLPVTVTNTPVPPTPTGVAPSPTTGAGLKKVGTINFRVKTGVSGPVSIDFRLTPDSKVIEQNTAADILGTTIPLNLNISGVGITPTISPAPGAPVIAFNVKFRDINWDIGSPIVVVRVKRDTFFSEFTNIPLTHTANGVYSATNVALNGVTPGGNYKLYVKGPKHLARGFSNITLAAGNNGPFDWSGTPLEPGDLPPQDGVINSQDISRLIELLDTPNFSQTDLDTADLNYDGTINGGDVNELILTLSEKFDEDRY